jgi:ribosomal protein L37AE/L43A
MSEYVCDRCEATATFERRSVAVWEGDVPVGNALVLTCSACGVLHEVLSAPTEN